MALESVALQVPPQDTWLKPTLRAQRYLLLAHETANRQFTSASVIEAFADGRLGSEDNTPLGLSESQYRDITEDLLRAALVFACAGLDASAKALIEDAFPDLAAMDYTVEATIGRFAERFLTDGGGVSVRNLAQVLVNPYLSRDVILTAFVEDMTGDSLQSVEQLFRVAAALRVDPGFLRGHEPILREAFRSRNEIVHTLDLTADAHGRPGRQGRESAEIKTWVEAVLKTAQWLVTSTNEVLRQTSQASDVWKTRPIKWRVNAADLGEPV